MSRSNLCHAVVVVFLLFAEISCDMDVDMSQIVDCAKYLIENGIPELNIPQFADNYIDEMNIFVPLPMLQGDYNFTDFHFFGLGDFDMTAEIDLGHSDKGISVNVDFQMHGIKLQTKYAFDARWIGTVDLKGVGSIDMDLPMRIRANIVMGKALDVQDVRMTPSANPRIVLTGLSVGERISQLIGKQLASIIEAVITNEKLTEIMNDVVKFILWLFLNGYVALPDDFIDVVMNKCDLLEDFFQKQRKTFTFTVKDDL